MATIRDKILGLYIAFFNRAGDKSRGWLLGK